MCLFGCFSGISDGEEEPLINEATYQNQVQNIRDQQEAAKSCNINTSINTVTESAKMNLKCPTNACSWSGTLEDFTKHIRADHAGLILRSRRFMLSKDVEEIKILYVGRRYFLMRVNTIDRFEFMLIHLDELKPVEYSLVLSDADSGSECDVTRKSMSHAIWEQKKLLEGMLVFDQKKTIEALENPQEIMCYCQLHFSRFITFGPVQMHTCFGYYVSASSGKIKHCRVYGSVQDFVEHLRVHHSFKFLGTDHINFGANYNMHFRTVHDIVFQCIASTELEQIQVTFEERFDDYVKVYVSENRDESRMLLKKVCSPFVEYYYEWRWLKKYKIDIVKKTTDDYI